MQHVVTAAKGARPLQRQHVERFLDHTQSRLIPAGVEADGAARTGRDVEAEFAEDDLVAYRDECRRESPSLCIRRAEEVVRQALRGLGADSGKASQGLDESGDRLD
jgi:hypothetical protein